MALNGNGFFKTGFWILVSILTTGFGSWWAWGADKLDKREIEVLIEKEVSSNSPWVSERVAVYKTLSTIESEVKHLNIQVAKIDEKVNRILESGFLK